MNLEKINVADGALEQGSTIMGVHEKNSVAEIDGMANTSVSPNVPTDPSSLSASSDSIPEIIVGKAPDGGLMAWLQVVGNWFIFFNSWGLINSFGAFETYYSSTMLRSTSKSSISWIGSIQTFILLGSGGFVGRLVDAGHFHLLVRVGTFLTVFGLMMTSLATEYYQVLLAQGICTGLGAGLIFTPGATVVSTWFSSRRALAMGLSASGSSIGGVIFPIMVRRLIDEIGFPWAVRVIGFVVLGTLTIPNLLMKPHLPPRKAGSMFELAAFADMPYSFCVIGQFIGFIGAWTPQFYLSTYALTKGISSDMSFYLLSILNAASTFGRILPNIFADKTGPLNTIAPCMLFSGILIFGWIGIHSLPSLIVFAALYGFMSGALVSLPPSCVASLTPDLSKLGVKLGMMFAISSLGLLCGPPISGAIIASRNGGTDFVGAMYFAGSVSVVGSAFLFASRFSKTGLVLRVVA